MHNLHRCSQATYCAEKLGLDPEKVNVNGGAIALGRAGTCHFIDTFHFSSIHRSTTGAYNADFHRRTRRQGYP
jgi:hypothetical protein